MMSFEDKKLLVTVKYDIICNKATRPLEKYGQAVFESPQFTY